MSDSCSVPGCKNKSGNECREFFPLPTNEITRQTWLTFCCLTAENLDHSKVAICSNHFDQNAYLTEVNNVGSLTYLIKFLDPEAFPTLNLPPAAKNISLKDIQLQLDKRKNKTVKNLQYLEESNYALQKRIDLIEEDIQHKMKQLKEQERTLIKLRSQDREGLSHEALSKVFSRNQIKLLSGNKRTTWTDDDFAVGHTIMHLSNRRFYNYLTKVLNYPFPASSSVQAFVKRNKALKRVTCVSSTKNL
ncbi:uncharacterized protein [Diabrotica undecimpunctata]|uniref:uncharacterized protein n=1 Tax=Diabrotica undecimpunctata TaxID=50387 RepID=UPI003B6322DB